MWIIGEESVQTILLLASAAFPTVHLFVLVCTLFPVHVLFEGVEVERASTSPRVLLAQKGATTSSFTGHAFLKCEARLVSLLGISYLAAV